MELFAKRMVDNFKAFHFFQSANFLREKDILAATAIGFLKIFHRNLWKTPVKKLIFLSCRLGIYSFTKNRKFTGVLKGFWLHPPLTRLQTAIFKLEVLLSIFCGTKITLIWTTPIPPPPPPLTPIFRSTPPPPIMPYPPINIEMFSTLPSHYSIFWRLHTLHL